MKITTTNDVPEIIVIHKHWERNARLHEKHITLSRAKLTSKHGKEDRFVNNRILDNGLYVGSDSYIELRHRNSMVYHKDVPVISSKCLKSMMGDHESGNYMRLRLEFCKDCGIYYYHRESHQETERHKSGSKSPPDLVLQYGDKKGTNIVISTELPGEETYKIQLLNDSSKNIQITGIDINSEAAYSYTTLKSQKTTGHRRYRVIYTSENLRKNSVSKQDFYLHLEDRVQSSEHTIRINYNKNNLLRCQQLKIVLQKYCNVNLDIDTEKKNQSMWKPVNFEGSECPNTKNYVSQLPRLDDKVYATFKNTENHYRTPMKERKEPKDPAISDLINKLKEETTKDNLVSKWEIMTYLEYFAAKADLKYAKVDFLALDQENSETVLKVGISLEKATLMDIKTQDRVIIQKLNGDQVHGKVKVMDLDVMEVVLESEPVPMENGEKLKLTTFFNKQCHNITMDTLNKTTEYSLELLFAEGENYPMVVLKEFRPSQQDLSKDQQLCVQKIVSFHDEVPFLLTGAPGSGKSKILVEVTIQMLLMYPDEKVLICVPSNAALATLQHKLMKHIQEAGYGFKIVKISSSSAKTGKYCHKYCYLTKDGTTHDFPPIEEIVSANAILTTLQGAIRLQELKYNGGTTNIKVRTVLTDEACFCSEIGALIPVISQLQGEQRKLKVVFSGDPKQLQYSSRSEVVQEHCGEDVITRLQQQQIYKKDKNLSHDLVENFRYPRLVSDILNEISYHNSIVTCGNNGDGEIRIVHCDSEYYTTQGHSNYSVSEAKVVLQEVSRCTGSKRVITLYKGQEALLKRMMKQNKVINTELSTAESAQGDESDCVIISATIMSPVSPWHNSANRLGMILSRTRSKIVIVADLYKLCKIKKAKPIFKKALSISKDTICAPDHVMRAITDNVYKK